jgi:hypothetical protein
MAPELNTANARHSIDEPTDRQPTEKIKNAEGEPLQKSELGIGDVQILLNRRDQQGNDRAVEQGKQIGERQESDHVPGGRWTQTIGVFSKHGYESIRSTHLASRKDPGR